MTRPSGVEASGDSTTESTTWRFAAATRVGTGHVREGLPCQDRYRCEVTESDHGPVLIAVVADGAGSAQEGALGAAYVCEELLRQVQLSLSSVMPTDAAGWLTECVLRMRDGLFEEADRLSLPPRQLASTLLCAVLAEDWSAFAQIGDGAIVTPERGTDEWAWLFWPQRGEYANTTMFVTDPAAMEHLEVDALTNGQHEVALFTDGLQHLVLHYGEQVVHAPFFERMLSPVRRSSAVGEDHRLSVDLETYLGSPAVVSRTDDDVTLVMASRLAE